MVFPSLSSLILLAAVGNAAGRGPRHPAELFRPSVDSTPQSGAPSPAQLTVRPHEMATGTKNDKAGEQVLDSATGALIYVPKNCVGTRRVPLIVVLGGGGHSAQEMIDEQQALAEKYGAIILAPNSLVGEGVWDVVQDYAGGTAEMAQGGSGVSLKVLKFDNVDVRNIDNAMKLALRKFAIDPDKIALTGFSNGGSYSFFLGRSNPDIFKRIAPLSGLIPFDGMGPKDKTNKTPFFISGGIAENMVAQTVAMGQELRAEGRPVVTLLGLRGHVDHPEDEDFAWAWLTKGWTNTPGAPDLPRPAADSDPVLTVDAMKKMTAFWTSFTQESNEIQNTARMANQEMIALSLGAEPVYVIKTNMRTMATKYPSVASDLQKAGLTVEQEEALRAAILRVGFTRTAKITGVPPTSVLGQNLAFREAHDSAFKALAHTGIWTTQ